MAKHLPVLNEPASSIRKDGSRNFVHPADVSGRFTTRRWIVFTILTLVYVALPFVKVHGRPAVFLDVVNRRFYVFGASFNAQDFWLTFFLASGVGYLLIVLTTLFGRVWCGYACPQTVFLEGIYRRIERVVEGPRAERMRRNTGPVTIERVARKGVKHAVFVVVSLLLAHVVLSYFVSLPALFAMVRRSPSEHVEAFSWTVAVAAALYFDFAWFREQLCLVICPYGRLQSTLTDSHTLVIGYDAKRGEPRGKVADEGAGDCIDCRRCVVVCPTGIDIRNGLQIDCIGCAACVDACDDVMTRVGRPTGLVRYDSMRGFEDPAAPRRTLTRPRVYVYAALGLLGASVATFAVHGRTTFEAHLLRPGGAPFEVSDGRVRNPLTLHVVNKEAEPIRLEVRARTMGRDGRLETQLEPIALAPHEARYVPLLVSTSRASMAREPRVALEVFDRSAPERARTLDAPILGPRR